MELLLRCFGIVLAVTMCSLLLRSKTPGFSLVLALCGCGGLYVVLRQPVLDLLSWMQDTAAMFGGTVYLMPLLRCLAIGVMVRITAEICRDEGERAMAAGTEIAGTVCGLITILPLIRQVLDLIAGL